MALSDQSKIITDLSDPQKIADFYLTSFRSVKQSIPVIVEAIMSNLYVEDAQSPFDIARNAKIEQWYEDETGRAWSKENAMRRPPPFLFGPPGHGKSIAFRLASKKVADILGMRLLDNSTLAEDGKIKVPPKLPEGLEDKIANGALSYPPPDEVGPNDFIFLTYEMSGEVAKGDFSGPPEIRKTDLMYVVKDEHGRTQRDESGEVRFEKREESYSVRATPWMLTALQKAGGGNLVLDDFTNAAGYIQNIGLGLFQNNSYQSMSVPFTVTMGGTGNLGSVDGTYASKMSNALKGRVDAHYTQDTILDYTSRIDEVFDPVDAPSRNMFARMVAEFMTENPSMFARLPVSEIMFLRETGESVSEEDILAKINHPNPSKRWSEYDVDEKIGSMPAPGGQGYPSPRNWDNAIKMISSHWLSVPVLGHPNHEEGMARFLELMKTQLTSDVGPEVSEKFTPIIAERLVSRGYMELGAQIVRRARTDAPMPSRLSERMFNIMAMPNSGKKTSYLEWVVDGAYKEFVAALGQYTSEEMDTALADSSHPIRSLMAGYFKAAAVSDREDIFERAVERMTGGLYADSNFVNSAWMQTNPDKEGEVMLSEPAQKAMLQTIESLHQVADSGFQVKRGLADLAKNNLSDASGAPQTADAEVWNMNFWIEEGAIPAAVAKAYGSYDDAKRAGWAKAVLNAFIPVDAQSDSAPPLARAVGLMSSLSERHALLFCDDLIQVASKIAEKDEDYMVKFSFWLNQIKDGLSGPKADELGPMMQGAVGKALSIGRDGMRAYSSRSRRASTT